MIYKQRVLLVFGGQSSEHEVSVLSARSVYQALDRDRYEVLVCYIATDGRWWLGEKAATRLEVDDFVGDSGLLSCLPGQGFLFDGKELKLDVVFPLLHGPYGEDGVVQGLFEVLDLPYVGNRVAGGALGLDKVMCKRVWEQMGVPQLPWVEIDQRFWSRDKERLLEEVQERFSYPVFLKPSRMGSSVGVAKVTDQESFEKALQEAFLYDHKVLVEPALSDFREIELAVLSGGASIETSVAGVVGHSGNFYDFEAKYVTGDAQMMTIPAPISEALYQKLKECAEQAFLALDLEGLSRVDLFVDEKENFYVNEVNTMPGFTSISMYPRLWEASGLDYSKLLDRLLELAIGYQEKVRQQKAVYLKPPEIT